MHLQDVGQWQHAHQFTGDTAHAEKSTTRVMLLTGVMMLAEIAAGTLFGSMALLADGWHMATHVAAFAITLFAYRYARSHAHDPRFTFGTGKVGPLGGFASAVALAVVALVMALESVMRMVEPREIRFTEAMAVAAVGLVVNLACGVLLHGHRHHDHDGDGHHRHDHNLRAAYLHVVADALTSVLAIGALAAGKYFGWAWLDPVMGLVGAAVIGRWAWGLVCDTGHLLLDESADDRTRSAIRDAIEGVADNRIADLHVWSVGQGHYAVCLSLVTRLPYPPDHYKGLLRQIPNLSHLLVEVHRCRTIPDRRGD